MTKSKIAATLLALAAGAGLGGAVVRAQMAASAPISVKALKPPKPRMETFKGEVLHMNTDSITVRDPKNTLIVRTFTFAPALRQKLEKLIARGGYQYGDHVQIRYAAGGSVAQSIKGKPSKPF